MVQIKLMTSSLTQHEICTGATTQQKVEWPQHVKYTNLDLDKHIITCS